MMEWYTSFLEPGESILWQGKPGHVPLFYRVNRLHLPLLTFGAVFGLVLTVLFLSDGLGLWPVSILPLGLLTACAYYGVWQYILLHMRLKKAEYVLTDRRVLRLYDGKAEAHDLRAGAHPFGVLPPIYMTLRPDGSGTIILSADFLGHEYQRDPSLLRVLPLQQQFRLDCIPEASRVWALIHNAQSRLNLSSFSRQESPPSPTTTL